MRTLVIKGFFYLAGLIVIAMGVTLTIKSNLGAGAWDAVNVGLTEQIGLTIGTWVMVIGGFLIVTNAWIAKEKPDLPAVITILVLGKFIDFWMLQVFDHLVFQAFFMKLMTLILGIVIIAIGVSLYLQPKFSLNPVDGFMVALQKRFGFSITKAKTLTESFALVLALVLGGPIGIGTIVILLGIGPCIQFFDSKANYMMNKLIAAE
ncbi:membrane protein [Halobacillus litoralis]|uniref:Membrane protein n=1 Tax=Halobacillus litoralis TaxID=45668 RepID=A0A845E6J7_9BACI|nr:MULTISPECIES: YitT family protein [Halobacillus]MCA1022334.1 YitT family protein [Halobacillus litoralis]MYL21294.1 membrane protein [Halobacillus litoralis]MYL30262.1 membrane protein [Halobacillus halophilus]MYL38254.1 membrane protein [Halobacillus litoralis]